jgi:hypothetical protein
MGPQPVHRARRHSGWNNPQGVGEAKPEAYNPTLTKGGFTRFGISIQLSTVPCWKWPYGQKKSGQEPSCQEVYS